MGRIRDGAMLNDEGVILDDGTVARLAEEDFFVNGHRRQHGGARAVGYVVAGRLEVRRTDPERQGRVRGR